MHTIVPHIDCPSRVRKYPLHLLGGLFLLLVLTLAACQPQVSLKPPSQMTTSELTRAADRSWKAERYEVSSAMYAELLTRPELSADERVQALERRAVSTLESGQYEIALSTLKKWAEAEPGARTTWAWNEYYIRSLRGLNLAGLLEDHLATMLISREYDFETRAKAGTFLARHYIEHQESSRAIPVLAELYSLADENGKLALQERATEMAATLDDKRLAEVAGLGDVESRRLFPQSVFAFVLASRMVEQSPEAWPQQWPILADLAVRGQFADPEPVRTRLAELERRYGIPRIGVCLLLPLTGKYASIGWKIMAGANLAVKTLSEAAVDIEVRTINSEAPDMTRLIDELPPDFMVIGGPLQVDAFKTIRNSGLNTQRVFFTFLQELGDMREGSDAWRFYGSLDDQVRTGLKLAVENLGITRYGVLYPQEPFGRRMHDIFLSFAEEIGLEVTRTAMYPPNSPPRWGKVVEEMVKLPLPPEPVLDDYGNEISQPEPPEDPKPLEHPPFDAVFVADGWSQAQILIRHFFFQDSEHLLFLGPELWARSVASGADVESQYFELTVTPSAWWPENPSPGARQLSAMLRDTEEKEPEFWHALGFDFVRFAAGFGKIPQDFEPEDVNNALLRPRTMAWSMAPLYWDEFGRAWQDLFAFRPTRRGLARVSPEALAERMQAYTEAREKRIEQEKKKLEEQAQ